MPETIRSPFMAVLDVCASQATKPFGVLDVWFPRDEWIDLYQQHMVSVMCQHRLVMPDEMPSLEDVIEYRTPSGVVRFGVERARKEQLHA